MQLVAAVPLIPFCLIPKYTFVPYLDLSGFLPFRKKLFLISWIYMLINFQKYLLHYQISKAGLK